jgi:hypothetical protein
MAAARARRRRDELDDTTPQPRNDAYTGMLLISLLAMAAGCLLLYLILGQFPDGKPTTPPPLPSAAPAPQPAPGGGAAPGT